MSSAPSAQPAARSLLGGLNEQQRAAVEHGNDPLLIVAGAGTGKTATLAHRVAYLIANGTPPGRVLLLTFTRRAAAEMLRRVDGILRSLADSGGPALSGSQVWGGTFHSVASKLLRLHGREIGLDPEFTILDRGDAEDLMHACRTELDLTQRGRRFPQKSTCLDIYSRCVNSRQSLEAVLAGAFPWCKDDADDLKRLFSAYTDRKEMQQVLDYDDLLLFWHGLLASPAGDRVRGRFDAVLVDEYQDTNAVQAEIVSLLRPNGIGVTAVGDDAQAIYGFRAATVRNILEFEMRFPRAHLLTLTQNYRSTAPILSATNQLIAEAPERFDKDLWTTREGGGRPTLAQCVDEQEQTRWICERILEHREQGTELKAQAVLFRAAHHSADLELELSRRNIPFVKYGGLKFIEMAHVKDLLGFLRLAENPHDQTAALRILGLLPGVGPKTAGALTQELSQAGGDFEAWLGRPVPEPAADLWPNLVALLRNLSGASAEDVPAQVHAVRAFYAPLLERRYDNAPARLRDLEHIEGLASQQPDRTSFLAEIALDPPSWAQDLAGPPLLDEDYLILSTMHSAKGLEFDVVYVIHAADGNIPSDMATGSDEEIEEERRLFYVACTRARHALYVAYPLRYYAQPFGKGDRYGYAQRSRFLTERVLPHFVDEHVGRSAGEGTAGEGCGDAVTSTEAIRSTVRDLWAS